SARAQRSREIHPRRPPPPRYKTGAYLHLASQRPWRYCLPETGRTRRPIYRNPEPLSRSQAPPSDDSGGLVGEGGLLSRTGTAFLNASALELSNDIIETSVPDTLWQSVDK